MGGFDNAKMVKINNKEVDSIKTTNGATIYQRPISAVVTSSVIKLGNGKNQWLNTNGNVIIDWGDGTTDTVNNPSTVLNHTYTDGESEHNIVFLGIVTSLGEYCFYGCTGLTSVTIPNSVTSLGNYCFYGCTGLTSITIPSSVTSLAVSCFYGCTGLTSITIPDSVISIGDYCFKGCSGLTSITIPSSVTYLGRYCFRSCSGLTSITIPDSVTSIGDYCFYYCSSLIDYQFYWTGNNIITYNSKKMINNTNTVFTIPNGETANYIAKSYPSAKLVERS